ncbi:uncharacterized protein [Amphiura filiformis]|uniref:uncharacterized protein n=1 Tax=Amphiura filiformis TaxID=82378 RepID=UPI003B21AB49
MWSFLIVSAVLVGLGATAPTDPPRNITKPFRFKNVADLKDMDHNELERTLRAQAKASLGFPYPSSASCDIDWTFGSDCVEVSVILAKQIQKWTGPGNCGSSKDNHDPGKQDCMYQLFYVLDGDIYAMHQTPDLKHLDIFYMFLDQTPYGCQGWSLSYSTDLDMELLDGGRNYCNWWNLVNASGLSAQPSYSRDTSNNRCTEFTTANCSTY